MRYSKIPDETVRRLPIYLRGLQLFTEQGCERVSSKKLAEWLHIKPTQLRKDLSYFGDFGIPGVGYDPKKLSTAIRSILNLDVPHKSVLIGCGNLGMALLKYPGFCDFGLKIEALFDNDPKKIGRIIRHQEIEDISQITTLEDRGIFLAILAIPPQSAQDVADQVIAVGVQGILNFAPYQLEVKRSVKVININIGLDLARLPYYLPRRARMSG